MRNRGRKPKSKQEVIDALNFYRAFYGREPLQADGLHNAQKESLPVKGRHVGHTTEATGGRKSLRGIRNKRLQDVLPGEELQNSDQTN